MHRETTRLSRARVREWLLDIFPLCVSYIRDRESIGPIILTLRNSSERLRAIARFFVRFARKNFIEPFP